MPLEDLGLLCLLERIDSTAERVDGYARYGLLQRGLITDADPPALTPAGSARLAELKRIRAELADDLGRSGELLA